MKLNSNQIDNLMSDENGNKKSSKKNGKVIKKMKIRKDYNF